MASVNCVGVSKVYPDGTRAVKNLDLEIADGELMALVGPSGCGKTTVLRMIAGLEDISEGAIKIDGEVINTAAPRDRDIAMVFQNYALYPHMSVFENIAFPLRAQKVPRQEIKQRVERTARMLGLTDHLKRRPRTLSGGQRQRVAMGRAIVREPRLYLMDEPLSNLDAKLRVQMRAEIAKLQHDLGVTTIYVTHDQVEAMTMSSRIAVMRKGVLQQLGAPQQLYDRPVNLFVATFIGSPAMNLFQASVARHGDGIAVTTASQTLVVGDAPPVLSEYLGQTVAVGIRPEHLTDASEHDDWPRLAAPVTLIEALGSERLVHVEVDAPPVVTDEVLEVAQDTDTAIMETLEHDATAPFAAAVARFDSRSRVEAGSTVSLAYSPENFHFFDLDTGHAIH